MKKIQIEEIMTFEQVAGKIGVGEETIENWRRKGMPTIKVDKYVRAYLPRVLEWLVKQEPEPVPPLFKKNGQG
jgi:transcriptional regulator with XRE-family HTH domain